MSGPGGHTLEVIVGRKLTHRGLTIALAESCTGGLVSHRVTDVPGSSAYYLGSIVAYSNAAKEGLLCVRRSTLDLHGAVSEQTAREMARGVNARLGADIGLAVTGIAGPMSDDTDKPVGLVYVALATADREVSECHVWEGDRWENKARSAEAVLDLLNRYLDDGV
ncbi:MAG: CinA family protein [Chloroflexi bacterium]|nr:CinA family protein [Chloroflexota bacterium]